MSAILNISVSGFEELQNKLERYKASLANKGELFVKRLTDEIGVPVIERTLSSVVGDSDTSHYTHIDLKRFRNYAEATLIVEGRDILFIEFGAGIHYNTAAGTSPHPLGSENGYTIGSYGKGLGAQDSWWYKAETGETVRSFGTQAAMPVYKAAMEMREQMLRIAKEVFGNG